MPISPQTHQTPLFPSQPPRTCEHHNPHGRGSPHVPWGRVKVGVEVEVLVYVTGLDENVENIMFKHYINLSK